MEIRDRQLERNDTHKHR